MAGGLLLVLVLVLGGGGDPVGGEDAPPFVWPRVTPVAARPEAELERLRAKIAAALAPLVSRHRTRIGVVVLGPGEGEWLFEHNADRTFTPASNAKLFSTGGAWIVLA